MMHRRRLVGSMSRPMLDGSLGHTPFADVFERLFTHLDTCSNSAAGVHVCNLSWSMAIRFELVIQMPGLQARFIMWGHSSHQPAAEWKAWFAQS